MKTRRFCKLLGWWVALNTLISPLNELNVPLNEESLADPNGSKNEYRNAST